MIYPLKKRRFLPLFALIIFIILSGMLRFNSSFLTLFDAAGSIAIQALANSKLGFLFGPAYLLKNFWMAWLLTIVWAAFLRTLGFKVGFWWSLACSSILIIMCWAWSLLTFFYWDDGPVLLQMMPALSNTIWAFLLFQIQQVLVVRLPLAYWVKSTLSGLMIFFWLILAAASIVDYDVSVTTLIGSALFGYWFFRTAAGMYIRLSKHWQQFFGVDGKI
ncbi:hypothetical protein SAMN05660453_1274 [Fructobacillus durionis]|uniref:Uncharacterized protein n=2 Tax=Fructobacillus durionis TaxID=283737 RepID=A0A1I1HDE9_9LACO|nr:hypothetical protein [Fructobacillus durionis]SFC19130.1 hypothetical protein SAMN05660453_1274 [Fructobacillus durionis]